MAKKALRRKSNHERRPRLIVGVGGGAGSTDAFRELLASVESDCGLAFVLVQQIDSNRDDERVAEFATATTMRVTLLSDPVTLEPNTVYVAPSNSQLQIARGATQVVATKDGTGPPAPIDAFLHALAEDQGSRAVGIILSGAGSDGTLGLKAISDADGLTFAQTPETAAFDSMPRNAATTGVADHVLAPADIPIELINYARHLTDVGGRARQTQLKERIREAIPAIAELLARDAGHNFQHYKPTTLARRIQRRMQVQKLSTIDDYVALLTRDDTETQALFRELLISVTAFFRDPDAFELLARQVLPRLFRNRTANDHVRIWVAGCATGEEAYSIAILCRELLERLGRHVEVQVFATDINERALEVARKGVYPVGIEDDISPDRLKRFFVRRGNKYQIAKDVRELVLFSTHNLISDPPFSRQDMISCRNLLIYLGPHLQKKLIPMFHYALRPSGYLLLGPSENISSHADLFRMLDAKYRIAQRKGTGVGATETLAATDDADSTTSDAAAPVAPIDEPDDLLQVMQRIVLDEFAPKSVVVNEDGKILCASADMHKYLTVSTGHFQNSVVKMARSGLRIGLRTGLREAIATRRTIVQDNLTVDVDGKVQRVMLTVQPMPRLGEADELFMLIFHDSGLPLDVDAVNDIPLTSTGDIRNADTIITHLERELASTRDELEKTIQEMETANEELKSSNEELLSMNEELQSTNEELETSKEEIEVGVGALAQAHSDLENLLRSTQIATIFLDNDHTIRSFTPAATEIYGLIPTDIGRPLSQLMPLAKDIPPLPPPHAIQGREHIEDAVRTHAGKWFIRRVLPYASRAGQTDGIVVTFIDVTSERETHEALKRREGQLQSLISSTAEGIYGIDLDGNCTFANHACAGLLGYASREELHGRQIHSLVHHTHANGEPYPNDQCRIYQSYREGREMHVDDEIFWRADGTAFDVEYWSYPQRRDGEIIGCVVTFLDITDRKQTQRALADREAHLRRVIDNMLGFVGVLDLTGRLVEVNRTAIAAGGLTREDVIGKPFWECYWWSYSIAVANELQTAITAAVQGEVVRYDVDVRMAGDTRMAIDFMLAPVMDRHGTVTHLIPSGVDISDRKRVEREATQRASQLQLALESGQMGLWEWKIPQDQVLWSSQLYDIFGFTSDQFAPTRNGFLSIVHLDDRDRIDALIASAFATSCINHEIEFRVIRGIDGEVVWTNSRGIIHRDASGQPVSIISVALDITERKRRELSLAFIADVQRVIADLSTAEEIIGTASERIAEFLHLSHCLVINIDQHAATAEVVHDHRVPGQSDLCGVYDMAEFWNEDERRRLAAGRMLVVDDTGDPSREPDSAARFAALQVGAIVNAGCVNNQRLAFMLTAIRSQPTAWRTDEVELLRELATTLHLRIERARAESALRENEAHLRRVINNQLGLVGVINREGILVEVDDRSMSIAGLTRDAVIGKHFAECAWWTYDEAVSTQMRESMDRAFAGETVRYDVALYAAGNQRLMIDFMIAPVHDDDGNITYLIPSGVDISERKLAEQQLAESKERLAMAMASARMGSYEWEPESDKVLWDDQYLAITGLPRAEMTGEDFRKLVHPDDAEANQLAIDRTLNGEADYDIEFRITRPDGQVRWLAARGRIVPAAGGRPFRFVGMNWDITEQKQAAEAVRLGEARLQRIIAGTSVGIAFARESGVVSRANDAALSMLGLDKQRFSNEGFNWRSVVRSHDTDKANAAVAQLQETGVMSPLEMQLLRAEATQLPVMISALSIDEQSDEHVVFIVDLSQQKQYEASLEEARRAAEAANESKSAFIANMSHEIRTPMTAVLGYADLLAAREDDPIKAEHLRIIKRNGIFLLDIINDILDLSKIEAGKMEVASERFAPLEIIADVRSMMNVRAKEKHLDFDVHFNGPIPATIESDPKRLKQILVNLIGNAIKFTEQGRVRLVVRFLPGADPQLQFDVSDTGIGMMTAQQTRLFQPFSQGDASVTRTFGGTGLGLAISQRLAHMLGGGITVKSEAGQGSCFTFCIGVGNIRDVELIQPRTDGAHYDSPSPREDSRLDCHVLLVDDRRDVRFLARTLLVRAGALVSEAEDGQHAIDAVQQMMADDRRVDLVLLDMQMPRLDGYQTAVRLRAMGFEQPIIALTADAMHGDMRRCIESGCNAYLSKPIDAQALLQMVAEHTQQ